MRTALSVELCAGIIGIAVVDGDDENNKINALNGYLEQLLKEAAEDKEDFTFDELVSIGYAFREGWAAALQHDAKS